MKTYRFFENNSGGYWWLDAKDYAKLQAAGWEPPAEVQPYSYFDEPGLPYSWRHGHTLKAKSLEEAIASWSAAVGLDCTERGCGCCGPPFDISEVVT